MAGPQLMGVSQIRKITSGEVSLKCDSPKLVGFRFPLEATPDARNKARCAVKKNTTCAGLADNAWCINDTWTGYSADVRVCAKSLVETLWC